MLKSHRILRLAGVAVLSGAVLLGCAAQSHADLLYTVTLNIGSLVGNSFGPFVLDLGINNGATHPDSDNTITLSNFVVNGGSLGTTEEDLGGVTGSMNSTVTLTNSTADNEIAQLITGNVTSISFKVDETSVTDNPNPDSFDALIYENGSGNSIQTTDPTGASTLILSTLTTAETLGSVQHFNSTAGGDAPGVTSSVAAAVPEPASTVSLLGGLGILAFFGRKTFRRKANA